MNEKPPVKSYCGGKPNYCTPEETDNVGACVTCGAPKSEWLVDDINMTPDRVDETSKGKHKWVGLTPIEFNSIKDTATTIGYAITKTEAMLKEKNS